MVNVWAVVPSAAQDDRLHRCVDALLPTRTVVLDTGIAPASKPRWPVYVDQLDTAPNISAWWNAGIDQVLALDPTCTHIAVVNDDAEVPPGWARHLAEAVKVHGAAAGFTLPGIKTKLRTHAAPGGPTCGDLAQRMSGFAHALSVDAIRAGLRYDETLQWWAGDDDVEWRAAAMGGVLVTPYAAVVHHHPNVATNANPHLSAQAGRDMDTFRAKWGRTPW